MPASTLSSLLSTASFVKMYYPDKSSDPHGILSAIASDVYECRWAKCNKQFVYMDDLVNHVNEQHVRVERSDVEYQCKWDGCLRHGKGFNARYKMLIHIRTHTNEKPHKCPLCGKCFSRLENLKIHNRSHTGEKPYICPVDGCHKAYSNSSDRFKHVRTHQEEKPYICKMPGCNKRYTDPSSLRKHVRTHGHYFHNKEVISDSKAKSSVQMALHCPSQTFAFPASCLLNSSLSQSILCVQSNCIPFSGLLTSPLLSPTISNRQMTMQNSQVETFNASLLSTVIDKKEELDVESLMLQHAENWQDYPLDLSTSQPQTQS